MVGKISYPILYFWPVGNTVENASIYVFLSLSIIMKLSINQAAVLWYRDWSLWDSTASVKPLCTVDVYENTGKLLYFVFTHFVNSYIAVDDIPGILT